MKNTLKDLNVFLHPKQKAILNNLTEKNPIIDSIPVKPASHGFYNVFAKTTSIDGMEEVDFDEELPTVGISFELDQERLGKIGGTLAMPKDAAEAMGGYSAYANNRLPQIIADAGNKKERRIYYKGFIAKALANKRFINVGGTSAGKQFSMAFIHWDEDSTVGLYNPNDASSGKLFAQLPLNGGKEYKVKDLNYAIGKEIAAWIQFGLQLADERFVHALVNIEPKQNENDRDKIDGLPTAMMIDDAIAAVRGEPYSTIIYCHTTLIGKLALKYQLPQRQVTDATRGVSYLITEWNKIPFVGSYNVNWGTEEVIG